MNFKVWCRINGLKIPDTDIEACRHLNVYKEDHQLAYGSIKYKIDFRNNHFPIKMSDNMDKLLSCGGIYVNGRDKNFRPIVIINI